VVRGLSFLYDYVTRLFMLTDWHPQDWILIIEAIAHWDVYRDKDDHRAYRGS